MNNHSPEKIFPADPRLTAYAFGELEGDELKLIEAAVQADPALQAAVAGLRGFGDTLTSALGDELANMQVDGDLRAPSPLVAVAEAKPKKRRGLIIPFPLHYLATAAAACFAVVVWMHYETAPSTGPAMKPKNVPVSAPGAATSPVVAVTPAPALAAAPLIEKDAVALPEMPAPEVKFDQSLAVGGGTGVGLTAAKARNEGTVLSHQAASAPVDAAPLTRLESVAIEVRRRRAVSETPAPVSANGYRLQDVSGSLGGMALSASAMPRQSAGQLADFDAYAGTESYAHANDNSYHVASAEPLSTFSIDVDTASYSNVRRFLTGGRLPPRDAVRVEELINYFPYRYAPPPADSARNAAPFAAYLEVASAPWAPAHRMVRIGIKGRELTAATRSPANLVFLLDVSGSMNQPNKLPLVKESLRLLVERLRPDDRVAIVTYAGNSGLALPSTPASQKREILASLDGLRPGGSTNGAMGIHLAYDIAKANFAADGGINRVILCTDGDFNVGVTDRNELTRLVAEKAKSRVFLSVFGFGMGNFKDALLESLADKGNGAYGYIDTRREAEKIFVEQVDGTLATIAKDVKIQVEFNPARVQSYRLIGYENRILAKEDFNNDAVDAGDIGAGHTVTALYEIVPVGVDSDGSVRPAVDPLKYQRAGKKADDTEVVPPSKELLTVKIRYKAPEGDVSAKQEFPLIDGGRRFEQASDDFRFASAVAAWGMLLRDSPHKGAATFEQAQAWAENALGDDAGGYRSEFIQLVRRGAELSQ